MNENQVEVNVLDELNKGACMGRDAIHYVLEKVNDENLKEELENEYKKYKNILDKISDIFPEYSEGDPHETNAMNKAMTWYSVEMKTLMDDSPSKIAELLLQGTNMGIIEGRKLLNNKNTDEQVNKLVQEFVDMQEESVEKLKKFL